MLSVIRIHDPATNETTEVDRTEAVRLVKEAYFNGRLVINNRTGYILEEVGPEVEEILIVNMVAGG